MSKSRRSSTTKPTMKTRLKITAICHRLSALCLSAHAQGTAFTYEGQLDDGTSPANSIYVLRFAIFDAASAGNRVLDLLTNSAVAISNGLFTVTLDFGAGVFDGTSRWLEIGVRTNANDDFTILSPRQPFRRHRMRSLPARLRAWPAVRWSPAAMVLKAMSLWRQAITRMPASMARSFGPTIPSTQTSPMPPANLARVPDGKIFKLTARKFIQIGSGLPAHWLDYFSKVSSSRSSCRMFAE